MNILTEEMDQKKCFSIKKYIATSTNASLWTALEGKTTEKFTVKI